MNAIELPPEHRLIEALERTSRGPKRNGVFALWLITRVASGVLPPEPLSARSHARRLDRLQRRLSSLSVPAPLRRALTAAMRQLAEGNAEQTALALRLLVAPSREAIDSGVSDAVARAADRARDAVNREHGT